jgi:hypothetical protein
MGLDLVIIQAIRQDSFMRIIDLSSSQMVITGTLIVAFEPAHSLRES